MLLYALMLAKTLACVKWRGASEFRPVNPLVNQQYSALAEAGADVGHVAVPLIALQVWQRSWRLAAVSIATLLMRGWVGAVGVDAAQDVQVVVGEYGAASILIVQC